MEFLIAREASATHGPHLIGQLVHKAMQRGVPLAEPNGRRISEAHPALDEQVFEVLGVERAVAAFQSYGSTAPAQVDAQLHRWQKELGLMPTNK